MFENSVFIIPTNNTEAASYRDYWHNILAQIIRINRTGMYRGIWTHTTLQEYAMLIMHLASINVPDEELILYVYRRNRLSVMCDHMYEPNTQGIIINESPRTHFPGTFTPDLQNQIVFLEEAQGLLKQTPQHFLKIWTINSQPDRLYVYTNQELEIITLYKLLELQLTIYKKNHPDSYDFALNFVKAFLNRDNVGIIEQLENFAKSDIIQNLQKDQFVKMFTSRTANDIQSYKNKIERIRREIKEYEDSICRMATDIRLTSDKIFLLEQQDDTNVATELYKFLCKNPYIKEFTQIPDSNAIKLKYIAPLIYFSEEAAEPLIKSDRYGHDKTEIIKTILERRYQLYAQCELYFYLGDFVVSETRIGDYPYIGHPHIDRYGCFGNHTTYIQEAAQTGNYLGAIEEISQMVLNLNFYDPYVIGSMLNTLISCCDMETWMDTETGELISTKELLERRKNEKTEING